jgi:predicted HD phosphohydrolase
VAIVEDGAQTRLLALVALHDVGLQTAAAGDEIRHDSIGADIAEQADTHQLLPGLPHFVRHVAHSLTTWH